MTAAKRGKSALSRYLAERSAQREAERDRPDASTSPPLEPVPAPVAEEPQPVVPLPAAAPNVRTVRLTDRVEAMLEALAKVRGIDPESAISVAIAEDYLRCQALIRSE